MRRILIAALIFAATTLPWPSTAQTLRIALRQDLDVLDPTLATSYVGRIAFAGLCDKLFDIDEKLAIVPQLASGYTWTDDRTLVIKLRDGVTFHNGEVLDAEAVKYSLGRHLNLPGSYRRSEISSIDQVEVVDRLTVRIVLKQPSGAFLAQLTDRAGMVLPPKATEAAGKDFGRAPVCSGPFRFVERVAQDHVTLERFAGYWNKDAIHFDKLEYRVLVDPSVRLANLKAGAVELVEYVLPTDAASVKADARLRLVVSDALGYLGITNNLNNGPRADNPYGKNALVRQAFDLSLDRAAMVQVVFNGMYDPGVLPVTKGSPFFDPSVAMPARDVTKAKALLKQAGVAVPVKLELLTPNDPDLLQLAEVIQSMAAEAGFEVKIQAMEFASTLSAGQRGEFQAYLIGWSGRADADGNTFQFLRAGQGNNYSRYDNPVVNGLLEQARGSVEVGARKALYAQVWPEIRRDLPLTYLYTTRHVVGMSAKLSGFRPVPDGLIRVQDLRLAK